MNATQNFVFPLVLLIATYPLKSFGQGNDSAAIKIALGDESYKDYQAWVALGVGGIPHTLEGYKIMKNLSKEMKDPLDINRIIPFIGEKGDIKSLKHLPKRKGTKPSIAPFAVPHRQTNQHNDEITRAKQKKIFDDIVADTANSLIYKTSNFEAHNQAVFLEDTLLGNPSVMLKSKGEVGHIHMFDGSMHLTLSPSDTKVILESGWGELHGLSGNGPLIKTYMMIYSPRNEKELKIIKKILDAAIKYSKNKN